MSRRKIITVSEKIHDDAPQRNAAIRIKRLTQYSFSIFIGVF